MEGSALAHPGFPPPARGTRTAAAIIVLALHLALLAALLLGHHPNGRSLRGTSEISIALVSSRPTTVAVPPPAVLQPPPVILPVAPIVPPTSTSTAPAPAPQDAAQPASSDAFTIGSGAEAQMRAPDYRETLLRHIANFRQYPAAALGARLNGTAHVAFTINHAGDLLAVWLQQSSGSQVLDAEALATIRRSQPFPTVPDDLPNPLTVTVPISFEAPVR